MERIEICVDRLVLPTFHQIMLEYIYSNMLEQIHIRSGLELF